MKLFNYLALLFIASLSPVMLRSAEAKTGPVSVLSQQPGPTPFISYLTLFTTNNELLTSVQFTIKPKPGSISRPVSVTYSTGYLQSRGYFSPGSAQFIVPVFGLYANYGNTVTLSYTFRDGSIQVQSVTVTTGVFSDPCGYQNRTTIQPRSPSASLSYDFMLLKNTCGGGFSPTIMDTDGEVRWAGVLPTGNLASTIFQNAVYLAVQTTLYRMDLDGTATVLGNYPVTDFHHNIDYGKRGLILEADLPDQALCYNLEVDAKGNVLKTWNLATIISNAMIAGGDDPSQFVLAYPIDWFHNNAVAYRQSDNSLAVSSRENFVIDIDYDTGAIKWILGDPTKQWYQFPSLRKYALALGPNTLPPIGQHAVSFTHDDRLLLFDDGQNSFNHTPAGTERTYSAPRRYRLDLQNHVAYEEWNYSHLQTYFSPFCSSIYEDQPFNYLIDYAVLSNHFMDILGLDSSGSKQFEYRYATENCDTAWNAIPIHLENMQFGTVSPSGALVKSK